MKRVPDEYFKLVLCTIFGLTLVMASYMIVINIHHYKALSVEVSVSGNDADYTSYKNNVNSIEGYLNNKKELTSLKSTINVLKNGGVFRLIPGDKLEYHDLYILNDYFMNNIINDCWVTNLKGINSNKENDEIINTLINNSKYINNNFVNNGLTLYDSFNQNKIEEDYKMILSNYLSFSNVILSMTKNLGG